MNSRPSAGWKLFFAEVAGAQPEVESEKVPSVAEVCEVPRTQTNMSDYFHATDLQAALAALTSVQ